MFKTLSSIISLGSARRLLGAGVLGLAFAGMGAAQAQTSVGAGKSPSDFVETVANDALNAVKQDQSVKAGDLARINKVINEYVLPYVNLEKTTRLAAGRYWRQATPQQQRELVEAFKGTLIRTYSGAFTRVDQASSFPCCHSAATPTRTTWSCVPCCRKVTDRRWASTTAWKKHHRAGKSTI